MVDLDPIFYMWGILACVIVLLGVSTTFLGYMVFYYRNRHKAHLDHHRQNMMEDLELATSSQLLAELRKRPGCPYLLLIPVEQEHAKGMSIEVHNVPPVPCLSMLHMATSITMRELKSRGVEIPEFPPYDELDFPNSEE